MSDKQRTLRGQASLSGSALHTGNAVTLTLLPAPENTGFVFKRTDLKDEPTIQAIADHVRQVERATTLAEGPIKVHTVEHILSALRGMGVDNAIISMDSNEPPIGDGSARPFVELIRKAGIVEQEARRHYFELRQPVAVTGKDGAYMVALPAKEFQISCTNVTHTGMHTQFHHYVDDAAKYPEEIASARTFVFHEEVQPLLEKGLIKGGSLENAIVIRGDSVMTREPMRYPNEFARHKILDIMGDLALFPMRLKAHILGVRTGHALNVELAKALLKVLREREAAQIPSTEIPSGDVALDIHEVMRILPHRQPFLMVDRILKFVGETRIVGCKAVTINEPFFPGHFPGHPIMPGVLQVEAMAQVASILMARQSGLAGRIGYFMSADKVKFRKPVLPGDTLIIECELTRNRGKIGKANGRCLVNGEVVSEGELTFALQGE
jgi:UDP-3-O-[3-hydroxymyristoyl] N-acetylglucosamine deacetylase/3-hydroxyacyl-[acyl-carrier-protein] dehydratase